jgi:hypothetical protein
LVSPSRAGIAVLLLIDDTQCAPNRHLANDSDRHADIAGGPAW